MYDPTIGRWLTEDPIGFDAGDTNLYRYVGNGPTNTTDPSGLAAPPGGDPNLLGGIVGNFMYTPGKVGHLVPATAYGGGSLTIGKDTGKISIRTGVVVREFNKKMSDRLNAALKKGDAEYKQLLKKLGLGPRQGAVLRNGQDVDNNIQIQLNGLRSHHVEFLQFVSNSTIAVDNTPTTNYLGLPLYPTYVTGKVSSQAGTIQLATGVPIWHIDAAAPKQALSDSPLFVRSGGMGYSLPGRSALFDAPGPDQGIADALEADSRFAAPKNPFTKFRVLPRHERSS